MHLLASKNRCVYSRREKALLPFSSRCLSALVSVFSKFSTMENFLPRQRIFNDVNISRCEFILAENRGELKLKIHRFIGRGVNLNFASKLRK